VNLLIRIQIYHSILDRIISILGTDGMNFMADLSDLKYSILNITKKYNMELQDIYDIVKLIGTTWKKSAFIIIKQLAEIYGYEFAVNLLLYTY
jgi:hypothetical protein